MEITKEKFLENTTDEELFCLVGEFLENHPDTPESMLYDYLPIDQQINTICKMIIKDCKNSEYLGRGE